MPKQGFNWKQFCLPRLERKQMNKSLFLHKYFYSISLFIFILIPIFGICEEVPIIELPPIIAEGEVPPPKPIQIENNDSISQEELIKPCGEELQDQVNRLPAVSLREGNRGQAELRIRGNTGRQNAIFFNRIPIPDFYSGEGDLSSFAPQMLDKLILIKGAGDPLLGAYGAGGALLLSPSTSDKKIVRGSISAGSSKSTLSFNLFNNHKTKTGSTLFAKYSFRLDWNYLRPIPQLLTMETRNSWVDRLIPLELYGYTIETTSLPGLDGYLNKTNPYQTDSNIKFNQALSLSSKKSQLSGGIEIFQTFFHGQRISIENRSKARYSRGSWSEPIFNLGDFPELQKNGALKLRIFDIHHQNNLMINPWIKQTSQKAELFAAAALFSLHEERTGYGSYDKSIGKSVTQVGTTTTLEPIRDQLQGYSLALLFEPRFNFLNGDNQLAFSTRWQSDFYRVNSQAESPSISPVFSSLFNDEKIETRKADAGKLTIAVKDSHQFLEGQISITAGLAYDILFIHQLADRKDLALELNQYEKPQSTALIGGNADAFSPSLQFSAQIIPEKLTLNLSGGMRTRFPGLNEYMKLMQESESVELQPETAYLCDGSLSYEDKHWNGEAGYFFSLIENPIIKPGGGLPPYNSGLLMINGMELKASCKYPEITKKFGFESELSYLYQNIRQFQVKPDRISDGEYQRAELIPSHLINFKISLLILKQHKINIMLNSELDQVIYTMASRTPLNGSYSVDYFTTEATHNPCWLNIEYRYQPSKDLDFFINIKNITGDYGPDPFRPGNGRSFSAGVNFQKMIPPQKNKENTDE